jgi:hypothetical protein
MDTPTFEARVLNVQIDRDSNAVYDFCADPANFSKWASGLGDSLARANDEWTAHTSHGRIRIRFAPRNEYGVLDHYVTSETGIEVYIPMRVIASGTGTQLQFTLFRQPDMDDATFQSDAEWVMRDLAALKKLLESEAAAPKR